MAIITKLQEEDFKDILENYDLGKYRYHKHITWALMNTVYELRTTRGKFILKIFEKASLKFIKYQISIIDFLARNRISVPKICKLNNGKELLIHNGKRIIIQRFIEGKPKEKLNIRLLMDVARKLGLMNKVLLKLKIKDESTWKKDYQLKASEGRVKIRGFNLKQEKIKLLKELRTLKKNELRRCIIHGDFHGVNLLVKGNKLKGIIDFDDSHEDYLAYEIAIFMIDPFITEKIFNKNLAKIFFREYQRYIKLNEEERKAIYYFAKHRLLGIMLWILGKLKVHKDLRKHLTKILDRMVSKYKSFNKISLEEFMELF